MTFHTAYQRFGDDVGRVLLRLDDVARIVHVGAMPLMLDARTGEQDAERSVESVMVFLRGDAQAVTVLQNDPEAEPPLRTAAFEFLAAIAAYTEGSEVAEEPAQQHDGQRLALESLVELCCEGSGKNVSADIFGKAAAIRSLLKKGDL